MPTFFERYQAGEHESVWAELTAMDEDVRRPGVCDDALAVARETMRRSRHNIETLIPRLKELSYHFEEGEPFEPPSRNASAGVRKLEKILGGPLPLSLSAWWEQIGSVSLMGIHPRLNPANAGENALADPLVFATLDYAFESIDDWAESRKMPAAAPSPTRSWEAGVRMWRDSLQARGMAEAEIESLLAPAIAQFEAQDLEYQKQNATPADPRFHFDFAPDALHKANISGATYDLVLPDAAADCLLLGVKGDLTLVEYLRLSFNWGGFPGWAGRPDFPVSEIDFLTHGLLRL